MEIKYNEETGTAAIEQWLIPIIRGVAELKGDLTIHIKYEAPHTEPTKIPPRKAVLKRPKAEIKEAQKLDKTKDISQYPPSMTVNELMECLNIKQSMAYRLVAGGEVESYSLGTRNKRILKQSVIDYIERNKHPLHQNKSKRPKRR